MKKDEVNKISVLKDTDPMPFGKFKNTPMQDVPVSYLHWIWTKCDGGSDAAVRKYIKRNLNALRMENEDLIWND